MAKLVKKSGQEIGDLERLIPTFVKMKSVLTRKKIKLRPALPVNIAGIILTGIYLTIIRPPSDLNTKFLLYAGPSNSILIFCSRIGLEVLSKCTSMHALFNKFNYSIKNKYRVKFIVIYLIF